MTLTERIKLLSAPLNHTFASIERKLEFGQGTIRKWDTNIPSADKLLKVAQLLDTTTDWLLTGKNLPENISVSGNVAGNNNIVNSNTGSVVIRNGQERPLTSEATELLNIYESLDPRKRHKIFDLALKLEDEMKESEKDKN